MAALLDLVEVVVGTSPMVLDLACGTGTVTRRLLDRFPEARSIAVDVDPVLLTIASATFATDDRVRVARCDLRESNWMGAVPGVAVDAVLTTTALHWLPEQTVRALYHQLAALVRSGGLVAHAELMPLADVPTIAVGLARMESERAARRRADRRQDWDAWWDEAAKDAALAVASEQRRALFGGNYPSEEFSPPADWHIAALLDAGFAEAGVVWRSGAGAVVAAVR